MASYNISVDYDITCNNCGKYFEKEETWDLEEADSYLEHESGDRLIYYRCNVCDGEVLVID